eukprot:1142327-Pelagomonas_calceolata.AAC.2
MPRTRTTGKHQALIAALDGHGILNKGEQHALVDENKGKSKTGTKNDGNWFGTGGEFNQHISTIPGSPSNPNAPRK